MKNRSSKILFCFIFVLSVSSVVPKVLALEEVPNSSVTGKIVAVEKSVVVDGQNIQTLQVKLSNGDVVTVENSPEVSARNLEFKKGDKVVLQEFLNFTLEQSPTLSPILEDAPDSLLEEVAPTSESPQKIYLITDYHRTPHLTFIFAIFVLLTFLVGKKYGLYSILGMAFSFFVIFKFILPQIILGRNPVFVTILASVAIIPVTFYLSHGFNKKTHVAIVSTLVALVITVIFTAVSVSLARLSGFATEEAFFVNEYFSGIDMRGILLAGIIIGFLGVLDDITVSQCSVVMQLKKSNANLGTFELYKSAMEIGRDHITSMVNTLVLVYAGASLPLLLLFLNNNSNNNPGLSEPLMLTFNREIIADEVLRTLLGSTGLILAVPISTFLASIVADF